MRKRDLTHVYTLVYVGGNSWGFDGRALYRLLINAEGCATPEQTPSSPTTCCTRKRVECADLVCPRDVDNEQVIEQSPFLRLMLPAGGDYNKTV